MTYRGEWRPGVLELELSKKVVGAQGRNVSALAAVARAAETQVKTELTRTTHPYRTRTPATPGGPPALISGTLRRSITHTRVRADLLGLFTNVGTGVGFYPTYPPAKRPRGGVHRKTPSSKYGLYLETGLRNGATYPFLKPTVTVVVRTRAQAIWASYFAGF